MEDILPLESVETPDAMFCISGGFKLARGNMCLLNINKHALKPHILRMWINRAFTLVYDKNRAQEQHLLRYSSLSAQLLSELGDMALYTVEGQTPVPYHVLRACFSVMLYFGFYKGYAVRTLLHHFPFSKYVTSLQHHSSVHIVPAPRNSDMSLATVPFFPPHT